MQRGRFRIFVSPIHDKATGRLREGFARLIESVRCAGCVRQTMARLGFPRPCYVALWLAVMFFTHIPALAQGEDARKKEIAASGEGVHAAAFSPDSGLLVTGTGNLFGAQAIKIWDSATGELVRTFFQGDKEERFFWIAFSPDGREMASASSSTASGMIIRLWEEQAGKLLDTNKAPHLAFPPGTFPNNGRWLFGKSGDSLRLIFASRWRFAMHRTQGEDAREAFRYVSPDGGWGVTLKHYCDKARLSLRMIDRKAKSRCGDIVGVWELPGDRLVHSFQEEGCHGPRFVCTGGGIRFARDGQLMASWSDRSLIRVWKTGTGKVAHGFEHRAVDVNFSPEARWIASGGGGTIKLWDVVTGKLVYTLEEVIEFVEFSPDGRWLMAKGRPRGMVKLWEAATGKLIHSFQVSLRTYGQSIEAYGTALVAFSPTGRLVGWSAGSTIKLWDLVTGNLVHAFEGRDWFRSPDEMLDEIVFSPDGRFIFSRSSYGRAMLWEVTTGRLIRAFE